MSMYSQLLHAAVGHRRSVVDRPTRHSALRAVCRRRGDLDEGRPPATDPDAVPVVLAREVAYDVALLDLAAVVGIETDLSRFEQPQRERARLEAALRERVVASRGLTDAAELTRPA